MRTLKIKKDTWAFVVCKKETKLYSPRTGYYTALELVEVRRAALKLVLALTEAIAEASSKTKSPKRRKNGN